jgi:hypothetical protein
MPAVFEISFSGTMTQLAGSCDNYYVLSNRELLELRPWPAWCAACGRFVEAEQFHSIEWYDGQIRVAEHYASRPGLIPPDHNDLYLNVRQLPDLRRRRAWRATRQSPPKCIGCGSVAVTILWGNAETFDVPGLGRVALRVVGRCSSEGGRVHFWYFTPEGDRIPKPSRETRTWRHNAKSDGSA